jgi:uncharacterized protein (DUF2236 family)
MPHGTHTHTTSITWRINRERLVLLGWGRAILMQFAHPLIAAGVADHSSFRAGRVERLLRLHGTVRAMLELTSGSDEQIRATTEHIRRIHDRVHGTLPEAAGPFPAGTPYSAHDPALLRWVHATLLDSVPLAYERFVGPLSREEIDRYCREGDDVARMLGIPDALLPRDIDDVHAFVADRLASGELVVTDTARAMAQDLLHPPFHLTYWPLTRAIRLAAVGLLDPGLRAQYGFTWTARDDRALDRWAGRIRRLHAITPNRLRYWQPSTSA